MKSTPTESPTRPETTLVLASSVDGKLVSGDSYPHDRDKSWKLKPGVRGYLQQAYDTGTAPGIYNLVVGESLAQTGLNQRKGKPAKQNLRLIVIDHHRDLTVQGILYLARTITKLIIVCGHKHPITALQNLPHNLSLITQPRFNRQDLMQALTRRQVKKVTIQSAGTMNAKWLNDGLVDFLTVIVYPLMVGTSGTAALESSHLSTVRPLRLIESKPFNFNYIALNYQVLND